MGVSELLGITSKMAVRSGGGVGVGGVQRGEGR